MRVGGGVAFDPWNSYGPLWCSEYPCGVVSSSSSILSRSAVPGGRGLIVIPRGGSWGRSKADTGVGSLAVRMAGGGGTTPVKFAPGGG